MIGKIDPIEEFQCVGISGKFGKRFGYGEAMFGEASYGEEEKKRCKNEAGCGIFGVTEFGTDDELWGTYQERRGRTHYLGPGEKDTGPGEFIKKRNYSPKNPKTVPQQAHRQICADGVSAWQALTPEQKAEFDKRAAKLNMPGYNLFMSEYINSHKNS